jgi:thioredoxin-related protein
MKINILCSFLFVSAMLLGSQTYAQEKVNWITFEEAIKRNEKEPKKLLIDLYTDWCGWCKRMDNDTYANEKIAKYINENYYAVKFNAEQKEDVVFQGTTFKFVSNGGRGVHQLAAALTNNKLSYPTTVFMNEELAILQPLAGYYNAQNMEPILTFFGKDVYKKTPWPEYEKTFKSSL